MLTYDPADNLLTVEDPLERLTSFEYDSLHRMTAVVRPDGERITYAYDAQGRLCAVTPPNGNQAEPENINTTGARTRVRNAGFEFGQAGVPTTALAWFTEGDDQRVSSAHRSGEYSSDRAGSR